MTETPRWLDALGWAGLMVAMFGPVYGIPESVQLAGLTCGGALLVVETITYRNQWGKWPWR